MDCIYTALLSKSTMQYRLTFTHSRTHSHTHRQRRPPCKSTASSSRRITVRCLAQGTPPHSPGSGGAGDQTSNLAVASQPAPPPELLPQLLQFLHIAQKTTLWWADDSLVVPGVRDGPVHAELVALQLVELVPGVRVLARPHHRGPNI